MRKLQTCATSKSLHRFSSIFLREFRRVRICGSCFEQDSRIPPLDYFRHAREIVLSLHRAHAVTPIIIFVRNPIAETNHRRDDVRRRNIRDIETLHDARGAGQMQCVGEFKHICHGVDRARQTSAREPSCWLCGSPQIVDHIAQFRCLLEIHFLRSLVHLLLKGRDHLSRFAF